MTGVVSIRLIERGFAGNVVAESTASKALFHSRVDVGSYLLPITAPPAQATPLGSTYDPLMIKFLPNRDQGSPRCTEQPRNDEQQDSQQYPEPPSQPHPKQNTPPRMLPALPRLSVPTHPESRPCFSDHALTQTTRIKRSCPFPGQRLRPRPRLRSNPP